MEDYGRKEMHQLFLKKIEEILVTPNREQGPINEDGWEILNATSNCFFDQCAGNGIQYLHKNGESIKAACRCRIDSRPIRLFNIANIPDEFKKISVDSFDLERYTTESERNKASEAKRIAVKFVRHYDEFKKLNKGLYLYSKMNGSGKTRLAISILKALIIRNNIEGVFSSEYEILDRIKATFSSQESTSEIINFYSKKNLLIIDDFGMEKQTAWVQQTYAKILDERMKFNRLTIFTSNISLREVQQIYEDNRLPNRLNRMIYVIEMPEESVRSKISEEMNEKIQSLIFDDK